MCFVLLAVCSVLIMAAYIDSFPATVNTPFRNFTVGLGREGVITAGVESPNTSNTVTTAIRNALGTEMTVRYLIRNRTQLLIGSLYDPTFVAGNVFGLPSLDIADTESTSLSEIHVKIRRDVFTYTSLLVDVEDGSDNELCFYLEMPYPTGSSSSKLQLLCVITKLDSYRIDFNNNEPARTPLLRFVEMEDFADVTKFPIDALVPHDIARVYALGTMHSFPLCEFIPDIVAPGLPLGPPGGAGTVRSLGTFKPAVCDDFHGFGNVMTPLSFEFEKYAEQCNNRLRQCVTPESKYQAFRDLFKGDAYDYVEAFEKTCLPVMYTFESLRDYVLAMSPLAANLDKSRAEFKALHLVSYQKEEEYLAFQRVFNHLVIKIPGYSDVMKRNEFLDRLPDVLLHKIIDDSNKCPVHPRRDDAMDPKIPGNPYTITVLQAHALDIVRRYQSKRLNSQNGMGTDAANPSSKRQRRKSRDNGKNAQLRSTFTKQERQSVGTGGKNGVFRDGTPKTCNNCNSPDHLAHECTKGPMKLNKSQLSDAKSGDGSRGSGGAAKPGFPRFAAAGSIDDSNLSKKAKKDLKRFLSAQAGLLPAAGGNSASAGPSTPVAPSITGSQSGNAGAEVVGGQSLSMDRVRQLMGLRS